MQTGRQADRQTQADGDIDMERDREERESIQPCIHTSEYLTEHVCIYVSICAYIHLNMCSHIYLSMCLYVHVYMYFRMSYEHRYVCICMNVYSHACSHICTCVIVGECCTLIKVWGREKIGRERESSTNKRQSTSFPRAVSLTKLSSSTATAT